MQKNRLEALSDGIFAIIMTVLIIEVKIPVIPKEEISNGHFLALLMEDSSLLISYFFSYIILAMFWLHHHALFHLFTKNINRQMVILNIIYLSFLGVIPFSTHLIGSYPKLEAPMIIYGINVILVEFVALAMFIYAIKSKEIENPELHKRTVKKTLIRHLLTPFFTLLGIAASFLYLPLTGYLYIFPIIFNIIPGSINFLEKKFNFRIE